MLSFASAFQLFLDVKLSSLFHVCIRLIFMFSRCCTDELDPPSRELNKCFVYTTAELRARVVAT